MSASLVILTACLLALGYGQVSIDPVQISGRVGENVTITCIVGTVEPESAQLTTDNNQQLTVNGRDILSDRVVFYYGPLTPEDDGRLVVCNYGTERATGSISVLFPAIFSLVPQEREVMEGSQAYTVEINVTGNPLPTNEDTTWTFNGGNLGSEVSVTYNSISFGRVSREHSGMYNVSSVTSAGPSNVLIVTLNVLYRPTFTTGLSTDIACEGDSSPFVCAVMVGNSGSLNCAAVGFPAPCFNITSSSPRITGDMSTGEVTFNSVTADDNEAMVECSVTNRVGNEQRSFVILVGSPPTQPTRVMADVEGELVVIRWEYSDPVNNVPPSGFTYTVTTTGESEVLVVTDSTPGNVRTVSVPLSMLEEDTRYSVQVSASNILGTSQLAGIEFSTPTRDLGNGNLLSSTPCLVSVLLMLTLTTLLSL